jgi:hypothetical protein
VKISDALYKKSQSEYSLKFLGLTGFVIVIEFAPDILAYPESPIG